MYTTLLAGASLLSNIVMKKFSFPLTLLTVTLTVTPSGAPKSNKKTIIASTCLAVIHSLVSTIIIGSCSVYTIIRISCFVLIYTVVILPPTNVWKVVCPLV